MVYKNKRYVINDEGRECTVCSIFKPWHEFAKHQKGAHGRQAMCRDCFRSRYHPGRKKRKEYHITDDGRECSRCGQFKPWGSFHKRSDVSTGHMSACKACVKKKYRGEKNRGEVRDRELQRKYGITLKEYNVILDSQGGSCAICEATETSVRTNGVVCYLSVDHNHDTGAIRGLLCQKCNSLLGMADDDEGILRAAILYLQKCQSIG